MTETPTSERTNELASASARFGPTVAIVPHDWPDDVKPFTHGELRALLTMAQHLATVTAERDRAREIACCEDCADSMLSSRPKHCKKHIMEIASWP